MLATIIVSALLLVGAVVLLTSAVMQYRRQAAQFRVSVDADGQRTVTWLKPVEVSGDAYFSGDVELPTQTTVLGPLDTSHARAEVILTDSSAGARSTTNTFEHDVVIDAGPHPLTFAGQYGETTLKNGCIIVQDLADRTDLPDYTLGYDSRVQRPAYWFQGQLHHCFVRSPIYWHGQLAQPITTEPGVALHLDNWTTEATRGAWTATGSDPQGAWVCPPSFAGEYAFSVLVFTDNRDPAGFAVVVLVDGVDYAERQVRTEPTNTETAPYCLSISGQVALIAGQQITLELRPEAAFTVGIKSQPTQFSLAYTGRTTVE